MKRTLAAFTGTRAEYGLLRAVLLLLAADPQTDLHLLVGGTHFAPEYGLTVEEIEADGLPVNARLPMLPQGEKSVDFCVAMGGALADLGRCLSARQPDMLLLLGDRWETFCAAAAAHTCRIPVAHIHGGEITQGALDDAFRHAITKLSHWHFTSCEAHYQRVIQLGEAPERVWNVGALGVENALNLPLLSRHDIRTALGVEARPYFLCTFHPATLEAGQEEEQVTALLNALDAFPEHCVVFTSANVDAGGARINALVREWAARQPQRVRHCASLGVTRYLSAARFAACVVGNSSSGILEIPSLGIPVLDIGSRQEGRIRSQAVLHCPPNREAITTALALALTPEHKALAQTSPNPYAGKDTARSIATVLCSQPLHGILEKSFWDLAESGRAKA